MKSIISKIHFDPTGQLIALADNKTIQIILTSDGSTYFAADIPQNLDNRDLLFRTLDFSPDGKYLAVNTVGSDVVIYSVEKKSQFKILNGHSDSVTAIYFLKDNVHLLTAGRDGKICKWDYINGTIVKSIVYTPQNLNAERKIVPITSLTVTQNEEIVCASYESTVELFDLSLNKVEKSIISNAQYIYNLVSSPQLHTICIFSQDPIVKIYDLNSVKDPIQVLKGHKNSVICGDFSHNTDYPLLLTGSRDETIKGWNYNTGENVFTIIHQVNTIFSISHHPNQRIFASCSGDGIVFLWSY